jgi:hypothetical protein
MRISIGILSLVVVAILVSACDRNPKAPLSALSRNKLSDLRAAFNADTAGPRVVVFFSSGCAACDTGSRALQNTLETLNGPLTVIGVWEPIFETDPAPTQKLFGNIKDARVHQVWDPDHIMSDEMRASELAHPGSLPQARTRTNSVDTGGMYDTVAIFRPGARWEVTLPSPDYLEVGLEAILPQVRDRIIAMQQSTTVNP